MKKEEIIFLMKNGFSVDEIMTAFSGEPTGQPTTAGEPTGQPTTAGEPIGQPITAGEPTGQPTTAGEPTGQPTTAGEPTGAGNNVDALIQAMQKEIADLREIAHRQNRITAVIENPKPKKTFEENVEDLIMEVNK